MIKYLELTPPDENQFRQAKIVTVLVNEGDVVAVGDPLLRVLSGGEEIDLPARLAGKVIEVIVEPDENISVMTPLLLLETEVEHSTASKPISTDSKPSNQSNSQDEDSTKKSKDAKKKTQDKPKKAKKTKKPKKAKKPHTQQSLDLDGESQTTTNGSQDQNGSAEKAQPNTLMNETTITVPDIGIESAKVIELLVSVGDTVNIDDPLVTLESDKASMDVPSTVAGVVTKIDIALDQDVAEGDSILTLQVDGEEPEQTELQTQAQEQAQSQKPPQAAAETQVQATSAQTVDVVIPDIGGDSAKVIEIMVKVGDQIAFDDPLMTLESDKASMDVPSPFSGTIESIDVSLDQDVSEGTLIARVTTTDNQAEPASNAPSIDHASAPPPAQPTAQAPSKADSATPQAVSSDVAPVGGSDSHASPSVRRFARELGANLSQIKGTGRKGRITQEDVTRFVKGVVTGAASGASTNVSAKVSDGSGIPAIPAVDFSKFGDTEIQPLNRIKKLTAANLHRSWLNVPHVTHNDESNISDLEAFRKQLNEENKSLGNGIKLSPLAFIVKAVVNALQRFPQFNASLEPGGENLILKKYFHIGIAVDTPNGLVVPVIKDADKKSVAEIATEMGELAAKARDKKLTPADLSGACFSISSLGGIGGTSFTPIVNAPEVAILGVARSKMQPVWNGKEFVPGMILPLSLSYDHRVIDGAEAARFTRRIAAVLEDVRRLAV